MKKVAIIATALLTLTACERAADVASRNISKAADEFEIDRKITFYNGITGTSMLVIEGKCSLGNYDKDRQLSVTCKTGRSEFKKHFLGLSDNVTYIAEQTDSAGASVFRHRVVLNPLAVIPDIDVRGINSPRQ